MTEGILMNTPSMEPSSLFSSPSMKSSAFGIVQRAVDFPLRNKKPVFQVFVIFFTPLLILVLLHSVIAKPFIAKVEDGYENNSLNQQDLIHLVMIEIPFLLTLCVVLVFASAVTILGTVYIHEGLSLGLKQVIILMKLRWIFLFVFGLCSSFSLAAFIGASAFSIRLAPVTGAIAAITYPYFASIYTLVLVICTVEDEHGGKKAFRQATKITAQGTFQGYFLMLLLTLVTSPVYILCYVTSTDDDDENAVITQFLFLLIVSVLLSMTILFTNLAYTLLYLDFKQRRGEKIRALTTQYEMLPTSNSTDN